MSDMQKYTFYITEAVYSDQYTSSVPDETSRENEAGFIQRLPYFTLVRRVYHERDEKAGKLTEQLDIVKKT